VAETIDTAAPTAPVISAIGPDSGVAGDHIANAAALTLSGTAEANSTVTVFHSRGGEPFYGVYEPGTHRAA
jgi:hypothetical protein